MERTTAEADEGFIIVQQGQYIAVITAEIARDILSNTATQAELRRAIQQLER